MADLRYFEELFIVEIKEVKLSVVSAFRNHLPEFYSWRQKKIIVEMDNKLVDVC